MESVRAQVDEAAAAASRASTDVAVVAVSKTKPVEAIQPLIDSGHRLFAENRIQEAKAKWPPLKAANSDLRLHLVGGLQTNKMNDALTLFDRIESVDRESLVDALARKRDLGAPLPSLLMQINVGEEPQKGGVPPTEADAFAAWAARERNICFEGVMGVPPVNEDPAPYFAWLRDTRDRLGLSVLSMGMSADFGTAIAFGATHVRIGSALFGERS
ncbi:MAG: YggS family pyridoxal phosphate-dependent enzyme [Pseudomonadota bacterium]